MAEPNLAKKPYCRFKSFCASTAERDHYAVTLSVDEKLMQQYGLITLAVRVTGNVLLFLDADQDDSNPQAPSDQRIAETMHRGTAERNISQHSDEVTVAHEVRYVVNTLPRDQVSSETERQMARNVATRRSAPEIAAA